MSKRQIDIDQIMGLFWNTTDNTSSSIAKKLNLDVVVVDRIIKKELDKHFARIDERVNRTHKEYLFWEERKKSR